MLETEEITSGSGSESPKSDIEDCCGSGDETGVTVELLILIEEISVHQGEIHKCYNIVTQNSDNQ